MRVVCIEKDTPIVGYPSLIKGNIYHVYDERKFNNYEFSISKVTYEAINGIYYSLIETGTTFYHSSLFVIINECEIDEIEMIDQKENVTL